MKKGRYETMSIEKKYTQEEIRAIVDEEFSKLKASGELSLDELENVSGGEVLRDGTGQRILFDGTPYVGKSKHDSPSLLFLLHRRKSCPARQPLPLIFC